MNRYVVLGVTHRINVFVKVSEKFVDSVNVHNWRGICDVKFLMWLRVALQPTTRSKLGPLNRP